MDPNAADMIAKLQKQIDELKDRFEDLARKIEDRVSLPVNRNANAPVDVSDIRKDKS